MARKKKFVEKLHPLEVITLEQGFKNGKSPDFRQRCQILLISNRGYEAQKIADVLEVNSQTVYSTINSWQKEGLAGLLRKKGQGRKAILEENNPKHVKAVKMAIEKHARNHSLIIRELSKELGVGQLSTKSLTRFLKKLSTTEKDTYSREK